MLSLSPSAIRTIKNIGLDAFLVLVLLYFVFHTLNGDRGALSWITQRKKASNLEQILHDLTEENTFLENKINLLQDEHIDIDILEENARTVLNFAHEDDDVVLLPK